jgi:hypothetical protein
MAATWGPVAFCNRDKHRAANLTTGFSRNTQFAIHDHLANLIRYITIPRPEHIPQLVLHAYTVFKEPAAADEYFVSRDVHRRPSGSNLSRADIRRHHRSMILIVRNA